ncbi:MAG: hypothetical protein OMM_03389 [Candidatus Magnetoglobus multicellularis str. Araruama]|uniref:SWIM-type domain-containing protein n=1 Tax=Candidatus Magnetoglobus multicellularis str. Araruama TaxID=890399 RepID=A0A1V1P5U3_9BACT|nr:MAG: hypothetical protein OMM_03389 [Candidatus Magnetoglobus multicellularis str. Araruama]
MAKKDLDSLINFIKFLAEKTDQARVDKAKKMLKASHFKLFSEFNDDHLVGVVKSQTDPDLVYSCRIDKTGNFSCCTQNLYSCGGLRGKPCKHLLVLIIGLVQAGEISVNKINKWLSKTANNKPKLDKNLMSETFLRYKGAESGEIEWHPTETIPEDYYTI